MPSVRVMVLSQDQSLVFLRLEYVGAVVVLLLVEAVEEDLAVTLIAESCRHS